ncbi:hypothetical protein ABQ137_07880 [Xanthomonas sp. WHRI 8393]|uniref:hypothetical protein n=1 Tax=Xanthomonas sp. WHRI 8393 TaxID=3161574 RepID=UPI0032E90F04
MELDWVSGVTQCVRLGSQCTVWWEAWSAIAGLAGLFVAIAALFISLASTLVLAYIAYRANSIARNAHRETAELVHREAQLLMLLLEPETTFVANRLRALVDQLSSDPPCKHENVEALLTSLSRLNMQLVTPSMDLRIERLHVLPNDLANRLARLKGLVSTVLMGLPLCDETSLTTAGDKDVALFRRAVQVAFDLSLTVKKDVQNARFILVPNDGA